VWLSEVFEQEELVYIPNKKIWQSLSSCLWSEDPVQIPRKVSIGTLYAPLEDFFVRILGVARPNLDLHVQALRELANGEPEFEEVKDIIRQISAMEPSEEALFGLRGSKILPVKFRDGRIRLESIMIDFAIVDRPEYGMAFDGKLSILNYTLEEVRFYRPFLLALGLERRYMSEMVEEISMVSAGVLEPCLTNDFEQKAYALFRYVD
jgi:hypothetical protein